MSSTFIPLNCQNCGGKLEIYPDMDRFVCGHCGTEMMVQRRGGTIALKAVTEAIAKVTRWPLRWSLKRQGPVTGTAPTFTTAAVRSTKTDPHPTFAPRLTVRCQMDVFTTMKMPSSNQRTMDGYGVITRKRVDKESTSTPKRFVIPPTKKDYSLCLQCSSRSKCKTKKLSTLGQSDRS